MTFRELLTKLLPTANGYAIERITEVLCPDDVFSTDISCFKCSYCDFGKCWNRTIYPRDLNIIKNDVRVELKDWKL